MTTGSHHRPGQSKQTQTPEIIHEHYESERVQCGKRAFVNIYRGKPLPKHQLIDCVLCYIKDKRMPGGFVLVEFPREDVMIFEGRLAYRHLPPFGAYELIRDKQPTVLVPFKGPDLGDKGRYRSSLTGYLKVTRLRNSKRSEREKARRRFGAK